MVFEQFFRFVFVLYCTTVGVILLLAPWTAGWDRILAYMPYSELKMLSIPLLRGAFSGFGLIHLVWGIHDLSAFLQSPEDKQSPER